MPYQSRLVQKLSSFNTLNEEELSCLKELQSETVFVERGRELLIQGQRNHIAYILQSGWGCSYKILQDGGRQIITFPIPGDCFGLRSVLLRTMDHSFSTITDCVVSRIELPRMLEVFRDYPRVAAALLWATSRDEAITVEHLASVGRRTSIERTAHFFLELSDRLQLVGLATQEEFECPLNQYELADTLGLSSIHVNRVLRDLRESKLITFKDRKVEVHNYEELKLLAGYENIDDTDNPAVPQS